MAVTQALNTWLSDQITVQKVTVDTPVNSPGLPDGTILITVGYVLIETQSVRQTQVQVI
jgi:hypothetical protein